MDYRSPLKIFAMLKKHALSAPHRDFELPDSFLKGCTSATKVPIPSLSSKSLVQSADEASKNQLENNEQSEEDTSSSSQSAVEPASESYAPSVIPVPDILAACRFCDRGAQYEGLIRCEASHSSYHMSCARDSRSTDASDYEKYLITDDDPSTLKRRWLVDLKASDEAPSAKQVFKSSFLSSTEADKSTDTPNTAAKIPIEVQKAYDEPVLSTDRRSKRESTNTPSWLSNMLLLQAEEFMGDTNATEIAVPIEKLHPELAKFIKLRNTLSRRKSVPPKNPSVRASERSRKLECCLVIVENDEPIDTVDVFSQNSPYYIGTGSECEIQLSRDCHRTDEMHAYMSYDPAYNHFELINCSAFGTTVDGVHYSLSVDSLEQPTSRDLHPPSACNCAPTPPTPDSGGGGRVWEGPAILQHGSTLAVGCTKMVFAVISPTSPDLQS